MQREMLDGNLYVYHAATDEPDLTLTRSVARAILARG